MKPIVSAVLLGLVLSSLAHAQQKPGPAEIQALAQKAQDATRPDESRIAALWTLGNLGELRESILVAVLKDKSPSIRRTALQIVAEKNPGVSAETLLPLLHDPDSRVRLEAVIALGALPAVTREITQALVAAYPQLRDSWSESAMIGAASRAPLEFISATLDSENAGVATSLIANLSSQIAAKQDAALSAQLVVMLVSKPSAADPLKLVVLENVAKLTKPETVPVWSAELKSAFKSLLASANPAVPPAALPLIARWDKEGTLAPDSNALIQQLLARLNDTSVSDEERARIAANLLGARQANPDILPSVARLLGSSSSPTLQRRVLEALGAIPEPATGPLLAAAYPQLPPELQEFAFGQIIKRSEWSLALIEAIKAGKINLAALGPLAVSRLRTHSDRMVSQRANAVMDELRGPETKEKNELIARLTPLVTQPGNVENGKKFFVQNCAVCHSFNGQGKDLAPDLTGMGAHGAAELLVHVVDPNRVVEPNFLSTSIETRDEQSFDGVIARENRTSVLLRNASGDFEIKTDNIKSRRNTGRSLMPEGFEALGGEGLRDILAYLCAGENRFRLIDMKNAFTVSSLRGIFNSPEALDETLKFKKFGLVKVGDVPFEVANPAKTQTGNNLVLLKGGANFARTAPQKVEIANLDIKASRLHFLGGVGGWAYPCCGENRNENLPVAKVTVVYADGQTEEMLLRNGVEFADYISAQYEVPGSKQAPGIVNRGQVRWFSKPLGRYAAIQKITLESFNNAVAPVFVAITAETTESGAQAGGGGEAAGSGTAAAAVIEETLTWAEGKRAVLIFGGGSSHDFDRWFNQADVVTLSASGTFSVNYTDKPSLFASALRLPQLAALYLNSNQPLNNPLLRKAIFDFAEAGKGLLLVHPGLWYNWNDWPEYNQVLVGGGARSHDRFGEFEVKLSEVKHPVTAGVPATFMIADELYHFVPDEKGTPIQILATAHEVRSGKTYPSVWIVRHPKARIVCIALGHDGKAHEHPAFKTLLQNSLAWAAGK